MRVSTKGRYALRLMLDIARNSDSGFVPLRDIAQRQGISMKYLEQIVSQLCRAGYLKSVRGPQGGYKLARPERTYTAGDILRVTEGDLCPVACAGEEAEKCARFTTCEMARFWAGLRRAIDSYVDGVTLEDLKNMSCEAEADGR
ncbi:MAG: RrF2 family transcriptional regulator [Clostridia bacterium]